MLAEALPLRRTRGGDGDVDIVGQAAVLSVLASTIIALKVIDLELHHRDRLAREYRVYRERINKMGEK